MCSQRLSYFQFRNSPDPRTVEESQMADQRLSEDEKVLHGMGYAQELSRRMGPFQSFAISFSIICIISGGLASFPIALSTLGPWMATIGWIIGGVIALIVAASLGQIASAYPTAGSLYHWSSILGGKFWGWLTAYINLLGLLFVIPAVNVILYGFIRDLFFSGMLGWDVSTWTNTTMYIWVGLITAAQCLLNQFGIKLTTMLTDFSGYLILGIAALLTLLLLSKAPSFNLSDAFASANTTGEPGGNVAPAAGWFLALLMGLLYPLFTITGFDASAHTSEETVDAQNTVHKGMLTSVFWSLVAGFIMALAMVLALPAIYTTLAADPNQTTIAKDVMDKLAAIPGGPKPADFAFLGWSSFTTLFNVLIAPSFLGKICALGIILANFFCALSAVTSTSRMVYAFARDGGLPGFLASVSSTYRTPQAAIWFTGILTFILVWLTTPLGAFVALSTGCAVYLYMSYAMPVLAGLLAEGNSWTTFGKFRLGGLSKLFAVITGLSVLGAVIGGHYLVPSVGEFGKAGFSPGLWYYTIGYIGILSAIWALWEGKRFQGPPIGEEAIRRRQAEIAAKEAALSGRPVSVSSAMSSSHASTVSSISGAGAAVGAGVAAASAAAASSMRTSTDRAAADKATAERAAAEKANADRVAAAKASADRADLERKAAAERAAAERLRVAQVAAEERLAAERKAADEARARAAAAQAVTPVAPQPIMKAAPVAKAAPRVAAGSATKKVAKVPATKAPAKKTAKAAKPVLDDITLVDGIGPALKKQLAAQGIRSLSDLSKLSASAITALDAKIPRDADQIADWVSQSKDLLAGKAPRAKSDRARS
jgi:amino acid transporter/predicted flap endonuclease-1-like 5' DNA nuclease